MLLIALVSVFAFALVHGNRSPRYLSDDPVAEASYMAAVCGDGPMPSLPPGTITSIAVDCSGA
jgi:hypothetical protein